MRGFGKQVVAGRSVVRPRCRDSLGGASLDKTTSAMKQRVLSTCVWMLRGFGIERRLDRDSLSYVLIVSAMGRGAARGRRGVTSGAFHRDIDDGSFTRSCGASGARGPGRRQRHPM